MTHKLSRRKFIASAAAAVAAPMIVPSTVFGQNAPSNRIQIAMIGTGKQGQSHVGWLTGMDEARMVAICDVDKMSREEAYGKACKGYKSDKPGIRLYGDFREVLTRADVDAVLIAVPDHWHATVAMLAAKAGKDIYCEKPLTQTIDEAWKLVDTCRRYGTVFQTGSQQRSENAHNFLKTAQLVRNGYIGELKEIYSTCSGPSVECDLPEQPIPAGLDWDMWLGPAPERPFNAVLRPPHNESFPNWRNYRDFGGGGMTDWGAHNFDIGQWALGKDGSGPVQIIPPDGKDVKMLTFLYDNGIPMYHGKHPDMPDWAQVYFIGTKGTIAVSRGQFETKPAELKAFTLKPSDNPLYVAPAHHKNWFDCIRSRRLPICDVEIGASTATVCHLGIICYALNRPLKWDPVKREFIGDEEANKMRSKAKREKWALI